MARPHGFLSGWRPADGGSGNHRTGPASVYGAAGMRGACYVTFFAFFGVFAFFAFARCGVVGAAALVLVSPGATVGGTIFAPPTSWKGRSGGSCARRKAGAAGR